MSDATVVTRYGFLLLLLSFLMHVFLSYVLSLICEAVLCLELVFAELGQAHYNLFIFNYQFSSRWYPCARKRTYTYAPPHLSEVSPVLPSTASLRSFPNVALHRISQMFPQCCPPHQFSEVSPMLPSTTILRSFPNVALHRISQRFPQCCPPSQFSEVSPVLPLKQFHCSSDQ